MSLHKYFLNLKTDQAKTRPVGFWFASFLFLILLDWSSKLIAVQIGLDIFYNQKFAFSLDVPKGVMFVLYVLVFALIGKFIYERYQSMTSVTKLGFCLILAGGSANILERLAFGKVVDFIFIFNGVINFADIFVLSGIIVVLIQIYFVGTKKV
ncbi:MAG: signal peptidase II [Candidatus Doudnabacteria bacterium]